VAPLPPEPPPPPGPPLEPPPVNVLEGPPPPEPDLCPRCGAPHDPYQEYCLECGHRLPPVYGVQRTVWSRESPLWLWSALAALLLVALIAGAIVAVAATDENGTAAGRDSVPVVTTGPGTTDTVGVITEAGTVTIQPPTTTILPTTTLGTTTLTTTTTPTTTTAGLTSWPAGKDGYTVVLRSVATSQGRGPADAEARRAINAGLAQVGVLNSSDYSSLRPGYYVVFSGIYDTLAQAQSALPNARSKGYPLAYVREVSD
jgi:hypothetical protein